MYSSLGHNPPDRAQLLLHPRLLDIRVLCLDLVGKPKADDGQTFEVILCIVLAECLASALLARLVLFLCALTGRADVDLGGELPGQVGDGRFGSVDSAGPACGCG